MREITAEVLEIAMVVAFGLSWPNNIIATLKNKSTKGKSLVFLLFIDFGYLCGIASKLVLGGDFKWYVLFFYVLNFAMVTADLCLFAYYKKREAR